MSTPHSIGYLDRAAASLAGRTAKRRFLARLDVRAGHAVLDVGCGPGTDLPALAAAVGPAGTALGVDREPEMVAEAARRTAGLPGVSVRTGDAHDLPVPDASVDRARTDRVLQHLADPARAVAELARVVRPGGLVGMAEPDWDTLAVDDPDLATSRGFSRYLAGRVRNPTVGRSLARLAAGAGLTMCTIGADVIVLRDVADAEQILGLARNTDRAVAAGYLDRPAADAWLGRLAAAPFLASFTFYQVTALRPAG